MTRLRAVCAFLAAAALTVVASNAFAVAASARPSNAGHALIQGSGSNWAANAVNQWVADVASQGEQVIYTPNGSATGRKDYASTSTDFGISDVPFGSDPSSPDTSQGRSFAYLPIAAGGTSFPYHLDIGTYRVRNLRLSSLTLAKIFTGQITNWNDKAIMQDNNGMKLPSLPIIPVVHAEGAGVSFQFTRYLSKTQPSVWKACNKGSDDPTEFYPVNCGGSGAMRALSGSDGVMNFIKSSGANGSIGMEEYSYPLLSGFPAAKLLNRAGYYTLPTQYNVAVALTRAQINSDPKSPNYLIQNLDDVYTNPDRRSYPLSSYVYAIIPTAANDSRMTTPKRQTIADFLYYDICQGQKEIGPIGYSSLPVNLVQAGFSQIGKLKKADSGVDLTNRDVATCHNPTFIAGHPEQNYLAKVAPQPPACDKSGAGPCDASAGTYNGSVTGARKPGANNGSDPNATGNGSAQPGTPGTAGSGPGTNNGTGTNGDGTGTGTTAPNGAGTSNTGGTLGGGLGSNTSGLGTNVADTTGTGTGTDSSATGAANGSIPVIPPALAAKDTTGPSGAVLLLAVLLLVAAIVTPALARWLFTRRATQR